MIQICIVVNCQTRMKNEALWHSQNMNLFDDISTTVSTNGVSLEAGYFVHVTNGVSLEAGLFCSCNQWSEFRGGAILIM